MIQRGASAPAVWSKEESERMNTTISKVIVLVTASAIGLLAADNSIGTWKRNIEKSKASRPSKNPLKNLTTVREGIEGGVRVTIKGVRVDGSPVEAAYTLKYDGSPTELTGSDGAFDRISVKQVDANTLLIENWKVGGKYRTTGKSVVSPDGQTMTNVSSGTDAEGNPFNLTVVYEKQ